MNINLNGIRWHYLSEDGPEWLAKIGITPEVTVIKTTSHHGVYRHAEGIYIKIFYYPFYRSFRSQHSAKACKEGKNALSLQQFGIKTPEVLAFGEDRKHRRLIRDVVITRELTSILPLPYFIKHQAPDLSFQQKKRIIEQFALLIKKLHDSGIYHRDVNFGNLFIEKYASGYRFALLDVDKVSFYSRPLSPEKRIRNLGDLLQLFWVFTTVTHRFFFLNAYLEQKKRERPFLCQIEEYVHKTNYKRGKELYRKSLKHRGSFIITTIENFIVHRLNHPGTNKTAAALLHDLEVVCKNQPANESRTTKVILNDKPYILKQYPHVPRFGLTKHGATPASHAWCIAWGGFAARRLPIIKPLIFLKAKPKLLPRTSYILFECRENLKTLNGIWHGLDPVKRYDIIIRLGLLIGYMHRSGCIHGDLVWENILVGKQGPVFQLFLQNLENAETFRRIRPQAALKDISAFLSAMEKNGVSEAEQNLFIKSYEKKRGMT